MYSFSSPFVSIHMVTQNNMDRLPDVLQAIFCQSYTHFSVRIIDNGSSDGIEPFLRAHYPQITFFRHPRNLGFAVAHNRGIRYILEKTSQDEWQDTFVLFLSPQIILTPTFLEEIINVARKDKTIGAFGGKILRAYGENEGDEVLRNMVCSDYLESAGFIKDQRGAWRLRGKNKMDEGLYDQNETVFGFEESLLLCRLQSIAEIKEKENYFDPLLSYGVLGIDLCWRFEKKGWSCFYVALAKAYYYCGRFRKEQTSSAPVGSWKLLFKHLSFWSFLHLCFFRFSWVLRLRAK